jgi:hypothetical protein
MINKYLPFSMQKALIKNTISNLERELKRTYFQIEQLNNSAEWYKDMIHNEWAALQKLDEENEAALIESGAYDEYENKVINKLK